MTQVSKTSLASSPAIGIAFGLEYPMSLGLKEIRLREFWIVQSGKWVRAELNKCSDGRLTADRLVGLFAAIDLLRRGKVKGVVLSKTTDATLWRYAERLVSGKGNRLSRLPCFAANQENVRVKDEAGAALRAFFRLWYIMTSTGGVPRVSLQKNILAPNQAAILFYKIGADDKLENVDAAICSGRLKGRLVTTVADINTLYRRFREPSKERAGAAVRGKYGLTTQVLGYLGALENELAQNPLLVRHGLSMDNLRIPLHVVPYAPYFDIEEIRRREHLRRDGLSENMGNEVPATTRVRAFRGSRDDENGPHARPQLLANIEPSLRLAVLLGDPGSGKTEWLKHRARLAAREAYDKLKDDGSPLDRVVMPIYLRFRDVAGCFGDKDGLKRFLVEAGCIMRSDGVLTVADRFAGALLKALVERIGMARVLVAMLWNRLRLSSESSEKCLICLDGWDEVRGDHDALSHSIQAIGGKQNLRIFVSSRIMGYDQRILPAIDSSGELQICPFSASDVQTYVQGFFEKDQERCSKMLASLDRTPSVAGLAQNPLLATLLCIAFSPSSRHDCLEFPSTRGQVYERVLRGMLGEWSAMDKGVMPDWELIDAKLMLLSDLAYKFFPNEEIGTAQLNAFLWDERSGYLRKLDKLHPLKRMLRHNPETSIIRVLAQQDGILVPLSDAGSSGFMFLHLTFQEYLVARSLSRRKDWLSAATMHVYEPAWFGVLSMLGRFLGDRITKYMAVLAEKNREDLLCRPYEIAVASAMEVDADGIPSRFLKASIEYVVKHLFNFESCSRIAMKVLRHFGEKAIPALRPMLNSKDDFDRANAIHYLAAVGAREYACAIMQMLRDTSRTVREASSSAIIGMRDSRFIENLLPMLADTDIDARVEVMVTILELSTIETFPVLVDLLHCEHMRPYVLMTMRFIDASRAYDHAVGLLKDKSPYVRREAVLTISKKSSTKTCKMLLEMMQDEEMQVFVPAIWGLGDMGTDEALLHLSDAAQKCKGDVSIHFAKAVGKYGVDTLVRELGWMGKDENPVIRRKYETALGSTGSVDALKHLLPFLQDEDAFVRANAIQSIGKIGARAATPYLIRMLSDPNDDEMDTVKNEAAEVLGILKAEEAVSHLIGMIDARKGMLCMTIAESLGHIGAKEAIPHLVRLLQDDDKLLKKKCVEALGRIGSNGEIQSLVRELKNEKYDFVNNAILDALEKVGRRCKVPIPLKDIPVYIRAEHDELDRMIQTVFAS